MKRICLLVVTIMTFVMASAQESAPAHSKPTMTIDNLFSQLKKAPNADFIEISPLMMSIAKTFASSPEEKMLFKYIKSMRILSYNECSAADKEKFAQTITNIQLDGFDNLRESLSEEEVAALDAEDNDDDETLKEFKEEALFIFIKKEKEKIVRLAIMQANAEENEYNITEMNCNMTLDDFAKMQKMDTFSKQPQDK